MASSQELWELEQQLSMAAEELEAVRVELTTKLQQAKEETDTEWQWVTELEKEVEQLTSDTYSEIEGLKMRMETERLRQMEDLRRQFDHEREQHRVEHERDSNEIQDLRKQLAEMTTSSTKRAANC